MMRFTVVDPAGAVSFVAPPHALKALAASCSRGVVDHRDLIALMGEYDPLLSRQVLKGLRVFDEHNTERDSRAVRQWLTDAEPAASPPFRVVDELTRNASLQPVRYGLVVFNLTARRIVQVQNSYADLHRSDRGRIWVHGEPTRQLYRYELPEEWTIVP
jgi:hypothetical protein